MNRTGTVKTVLRVGLVAGGLALAACGGGGGGGKGPAPARGVAVMHGSADYKSVLLSLVDAETGAVRDNCINSGSRPPALSQALSGDVVLPTVAPGALAIVDRENGAIALLDPATCDVTRQLAVGTGFKANPQDVLDVGGGRLYVTRFGHNDAATAAADDLDDGSDVLIVEAATGALKKRIPLAPSADASFLARPTRMAMAGGKVYVVLNHLAADFTPGPGRVVIVDPAIDAVTGTIDLPGMLSCETVVKAPDANALAVACAGAFGSPDILKESGVAWIDLGGSPPAVTIVKGEAFGAPVSGQSLAVGAGKHVYVVASGEFDADFNLTRADALFSHQVGGAAAPVKLLAATGAFQLGGLALDAGRLYVPDADATTPKLRVFDLANPAAPVEVAAIDSNPGQGLLPRGAALY